MSINAAPILLSGIETQEPLGRSHYRPRLLIFFPALVKPLLTPFRKEAVGTIADLASYHLHNLLHSFSVTAWEVPGEDDSWRLSIEMTAHLDWDTLANIRQAILADLAKVARAWTPEQRDDFAKRIYLELQPAESQ